MSQIINGYLISLVMMSGVYLFGKIILNNTIGPKLKKLILVIVLISFPQTTASLNLEGTFKTILMFGMNIIFYKSLFDISFRKALFISFLYMTVLIIPDLLQLFIATNILNVSKQFYYDVFANSFFSNFGVCVLLIIITYILKKPLRKLVSQKIENNTKIIIFSVLILICSVMFFYTLIKEFRFSDDIFVYIIAIIVLISVLFSLIKQMIANNKLVKEYDRLLEFMTTYEEEIEKQRILRHETKNEFLAIRAKLADKEEEQEILKYIDDILKDKIIVKQEEYAKFGYLPPNGIKGLCYFKVQEAEKKGLIIGLNIPKRIKNSTIFHLETRQQREFAKILGVFLDNAIEASSESDEKQLGIEAYITKDQEFKMIISNTFKNKIDQEKLGKESFSTKGKNRGHGLLLVNHIIKGNHIFETKTDIQGNIYSQTIIVKKQNQINA